MPLGIAPSDKKLLTVGGALLLVLLLAIAILSPPEKQEESPVPSTYSADSAGALAAYRLLSALQYPVHRWENPPTEFDGDSKTKLLILAEPIQPPSKKEREALQNFLKSGGHVLFTGASIHEYFPDANVNTLMQDPTWKSFDRVLPSRITQNAPKITLDPQAEWSNLDPSQIPLYRGDAAGKNSSNDQISAVVVAWTVGNGQLLWWSGSTPLSNAGLTKDDNLRFFLNSVANWNDPVPYTILWDEYFHGQRNSLWSYVAKTALLVGLINLAILAVLIFFTYSRRSGPIFVPAEDSRLSPLEFVDTLGGLYERAGASSLAISISYLRLRTLLIRNLGFSKDTRDSELAAAAAQRLRWKDSGLTELLQTAERARYKAELKPKDALDLVKKLESFSARFNLHNQIRREKP